MSIGEMNNEVREASAEEAANQVRDEMDLFEPPFDPFLIADKKNIDVTSKNLEGNKFSGCLMRGGSQFGIIYDDSKCNEGYENFTVAHELGHYHINGHMSSFALDEDNVHHSSLIYESNDPKEKEANHFAASLLMPEEIFIGYINEVEKGIEGIKDLAKTFRTSLTATAIRYAKLSPDAVMIVISHEGEIVYKWVNEAMQSHRGVEYWELEGPLPRNTQTYSFNQKNEDIKDRKSDTAFPDLNEWFENAEDLSLVEEIQGLGSYGRTLTVITIDDSEIDTTFF
jgi:Zn-dependent peptidase ImmA (M78 family)